MAVVRLTDYLAMAASGDGEVDAEAFHAGLAQFADILGDALSLSGATSSSASFGIGVDVEGGALITRTGEGVVDVTVTWDGGDLLLDFDDADIEDIDDLEIEPTFDFDEEDSED